MRSYLKLIAIVILLLIMQLIYVRANIDRSTSLSGLGVDVALHSIIGVSEVGSSSLLLGKEGYRDISAVILNSIHALKPSTQSTSSASVFFMKNGLINRQKQRILPMRGSSDVWKGYITSSRGVFLDMIQRGLNKTMSPSGSNTVALLLLGKSVDILSYNEHLFKTMGTLHLFVISGFHLSFIGNKMRGLMSVFFTIKCSELLTILLLSLYFYLVGFSPGLFRAFLMFIISSLATIFKRQIRPLSLLFYVLIMVVIVDISMLSSIGFQLSFMAIVGISLWKNDLRPIKRYKNPFVKYLLTSISFSLSVLSTVLPLLGFYFSEISTMSIVSTTLVGWSIPVILKYVIFIFPALILKQTAVVKVLLFPIDLLIYSSNMLLSQFNFTWSIIKIPSFSPYLLITYYVIYALIYGCKIYLKKLKKDAFYENNFTYF